MYGEPWASRDEREQAGERQSRQGREKTCLSLSRPSNSRLLSRAALARDFSRLARYRDFWLRNGPQGTLASQQ